MLRYASAVLSVGLALLLMLGVQQLASGVDARPALVVAVGLTGLYAGLGPGLLALALATFITRDPVLLLAGVVLVLACARFGRARIGSSHPPEVQPADETLVDASRDQGQTTRAGFRSENNLTPAPLREVTTEATWRFHHEKPLDITLPEDEQVEHLYLYSVLAECNDAFARMYGFRAASDIVGTRLVVFLPPADPKNTEYLRSFIRSGYRLEDAESHEIDRYGRAKYFVNNLVGIFERGQLVGAWGTQRDVTELRRDTGGQEYSSRLHSSNSSSQ